MEPSRVLVTLLSKDFHALIKCLAEARCAAVARARGWEAGPGLLGKVTGEIRRAISIQVVRSQAMCLFGAACPARSRSQGCS